MNRKLIAKALGDIDEKYIAQTLAPPALGAKAPERKKIMNHSETSKKGISVRRIIGLALAACLLFALVVTAYATNTFGIGDLLSSFGRAVSEQAALYIRENNESAASELLDARVTQSLCDGGELLVAVELHGGERYILLEEGLNADDPVSCIGLVSGEPIKDYAESQGKALLFVGVSLDGSGFSGVQSRQYSYADDGTVTVLLTAALTGEVQQAVCRVNAYGMAANVEDVQRMEIPFAVSPAPSLAGGEYIPDNADAIAGITVGNATVEESAVGTTIRWPETVANEAAINRVAKVEIVGHDYSEGGSMMEDNGMWYFAAYMVQGAIDDRFTVKYYGEGDVLLGQIDFSK